jgi:hypothetical protein
MKKALDDEDSPLDRQLKDCSDPAAARELVNLMSEISEDHYAAGWLVGLEFSLWRLTFETPEDTFGFSSLSMSERGKLFELTHRCQGWWIWSKSQGCRKFLTYDEWLPMYQMSENS